MQSYCCLDQFTEDNSSLVSVLVCLQKKKARLDALAVLREPIKVFRLLIASKMGYKAWYKLAAALRLEPSGKGPVHTALNDALTREGQGGMTTWDDLRPIADASKGGYHPGNALAVEELLVKVNDGLLSSEASASKSAVTSMLKYLHASGY